MSRQAKVRMADVLINAGYNIKKVLRAIQYPALGTLTFHGFQTDPGNVDLDVTVDFIDQIKGKTETATLNLDDNYNPESIFFSTITSLQHNGIAIFSFTYGRPSALLNSAAKVTLHDSDAFLKNKLTFTNGRKLPIVPGWPTPMVLREEQN